VESGKLQPDAERSRVKVLVAVTPSMSTGCHSFVVGMSTGRVELWHISKDGKNFNPEAFTRSLVVDTGARLTCLTVWFAQDVAKKSDDVISPVHTEASKKKKRSLQQTS